MTFKSPNSMPPYRIENRCDDVFISFAQMAVARQGSEEKNMWNWLHPREGGSSMAYAWDEPVKEHRMRVQVPQRP